ncbi:MAG: hypothetical protein G8237_04900 [Magnetococcales bacterium]|nr:hypothetical protein [Magnetococcales bacterium]NGZ05674.1 hypothetical protein [Magnetococcales bacterium]
MNTQHRIAIFKSGRHADRNGTTLVITDADLERTVAAYDPARWRAPLVIGHPRHDTPAWGWVATLSLEEGMLIATLVDLDPEVVELVRMGRYRNVSTSFYTPDGSDNPLPGVFYPRHVGLLGAQPPAVKGLPQVSFQESENVPAVAVGEGLAPPDRLARPQPLMESRMDSLQDEAEWKQRLEQLQKQEQELAAREAALRQSETEECRKQTTVFVDGLIAEGRILPRFREGLIAFLLFMNETSVVEFAEGQNTRSFMTSFLEALPRQVEFAELAPESRSGMEPIRYHAAQGYSVDPSGLETHARILAYANTHRTDYLTAALAVNA